MIKLSRYLKKYSVLLLAAVVFLFGQAILDLNIPSKMSNIVNTGIQRSGIEEIAPKAIQADAFGLMTLFMSEEDIKAVDAAYTLHGELSSEEQAKVEKTFPDANKKQAMVLTGDVAQREAADAAFGRAGYAFIDFIQQAAQKNGQEVASAENVRAEMDLEAVMKMMPMITQAPAEAFQASIDKSQAAPATLTDSMAAMLNKSFYQALGANTDTMQTSYILRTGAVMLLLSLGVIACAISAVYCFSRIGAGVSRDLRRDVFAKVTSFSNAELDQFSTSSLITRTTNDITQVQMMYTMGMRMLIYAPIMGVGGIIMALQKSRSMSWIIAVAIFIIMVVIGLLYVVVMPRFKKMQKLVDRLNLVSRENLTGLMVIRAFGTQDFQQKRFEKANHDLTDNSMFVNRAMAIMMPVMMLVMNGVSLFIIWFGAEQISQSAMQVGDMMAYIQYSMQIIMAFLFIAMVFIMVPRASVSAERIDEVLRSESTVQDPKNPKQFEERVKGEVAFNKVSFRYGGADTDVLHDISFTAKPGQTTAFIGSTGSGKSTLINLIPRFYDATEGSVTLDGVDIRELTQHELRANIGYVPQKGLLFAGNIEENLRLGAKDASEEEIRKAAEVAQAIDFIDGLDDGFESEISQGGTNVSGGQRQRLSIARALAKKAPVYIFDDSFSALDFKTDSRLRTALKPYTRDAAVLVVAQRVSTIMTAEQIVVMDNGNVMGIGTHEELLKNCATYREIAESQLSKEELA